MAATTLGAILGHVRAVCEGTGLALSPTKDAFTHDRQPNTVLTDAYWVEDGGLGQNLEATANAAVRVDKLTVWIARKVAFDGQAAVDALETTLEALERRILADGLTHAYHARLDGRRVSRPAGKDFAVGSATVSVDYDVDLTVT
jgi:hypothetical protein